LVTPAWTGTKRRKKKKEVKGSASREKRREKKRKRGGKGGKERAVALSFRLTYGEIGGGGEKKEKKNDYVNAQRPQGREEGKRGEKGGTRPGNRLRTFFVCPGKKGKGRRGRCSTDTT